jgi:CRISPR-associated protein Csx10
LVYSNVAPQRVMGWNSLYRLPKADELAVVKGSVFLFGFKSAIDDDLVEKLFELQQSGVGLRRREGYGQLLIANPFHWEVDNV